MILQDNFGGVRRFRSEGFGGGKIAFVNNVSTATPAYSERFIFERQTENSFKMSYEVTRDEKEWRMVDHLVFTRQ